MVRKEGLHPQAGQVGHDRQAIPVGLRPSLLLIAGAGRSERLSSIGVALPTREIAKDRAPLD